MGFEPTRAEHNRLAAHPLNHSGTSTSVFIKQEKKEKKVTRSKTTKQNKGGKEVPYPGFEPGS